MKANNNVVGIDLGTTNSCIAFIRDGRPQLVQCDGSGLVPSVLSLHADKGMLVGQPARNNEVADPDRSISLIKRRMGRDESIILGGEAFTPAALSGLILKRLKLAAEECIGEPVTQAVISVPAYFDEKQRSATQEAGELAGLEVLRLINEPTAAALAYTLHQKEEGLYLVYDLGGGTFDVSVVDLSRQVLEVRASHGDTQLGGADFDTLIVNAICADFDAKHGVGLLDNSVSRIRLQRAAEQAKIRLSTEIVVDIKEEYITEKDGVGLHLDFELTRPAFEEMIRPSVEKTLAAMELALQEAELTVDDINQVVLVGGSSRIPLVSHSLEQRFGLQPICWVDPDTAVVQGAAAEAAVLSGQDLAVTMVDVTPHSLGVRVQDYDGSIRNHILVRRNSPLPITVSQTFCKLTRDTQRVQVEVFQGESTQISAVQSLGEFWLEDLKDTGSEELLVRLELDRSGLLHVTCVDMGSRAQASQTMRRTGEDRVQQRKLADLNAVKIHSEGDTDLVNAAPFEGVECEEEPTHILDPDLQNRVETLLSNKTLDDQDHKELSEALERVRSGGVEGSKLLEELIYYMD